MPQSVSFLARQRVFQSEPQSRWSEHYGSRVGMIWVGYRRNADDARRFLEDTEMLEELLESDDDDTSVDLDKAWHGVHWLLTGSSEPTTAVVSSAIFGGEPIGEDLGYGPGRLLAPPAVAALASTLAEVDVDNLRDRLDPSAMTTAEVYPNVWHEDDIFETYLAPTIGQLQAFYLAAAEADQAVIQTIC